ncbi:hypothetical protein HWV62_20622 [Athelia sp. TMB]|nr:hypothetical protein HWV62_20622 [Athelia sp. TMB]
MASVYITRLSFDEQQRKAVNILYETAQATSLVFSYDPHHQAEARKFIQQHELDREARELLESRWNVQWSTSWPTGGRTVADQMQRTLLQCSSGFSSATRFAQNKKIPSRFNSTQGDRQNPYDYTGCLAHADITEHDSDGAVARVIGFLQHNNACLRASITHIPPVPLHPHVYEVALRQLQNGAGAVNKSRDVAV